MRTVQIQGYEYLQQVGASIGGRATVDTPPDFAPLLQDLQRVTYQTSNGWVPLSAEYMLALSVSETAPSIGGGPATTSISIAPTAVSALTAASAARSVAPTQTRHVNTTDDGDFTSITIRGSLGPLLRANRPPHNDAGHEFCVGWWCKGCCNTQCGRRASHVPFANTIERKRLLDFVREHLVVRSPD